MPRKKLLAVVKRSVAYRLKVKTLRHFVAGFDAAKWMALYDAKPRTERAKKARRAQLAKVSRTFAKLKPYVQRSYKVVRSKSVDRLRALADYANVPRLKGLRAVPLSTDRPDITRVTFDKQGRVEVRRGKRYREVVYKFPKRPRAHRVEGKFLTPGEHAIQMLEDMLPTLKKGLYVLMTRAQTLVPFTADRDSLLQTLREFVFRYEKGAPDFVGMLVGVKYLAHSTSQVFKLHQQTQAARTETQRRRLVARRQMLEREAKRIGALVKRRKRMSERARKTGRQ